MAKPKRVAKRKADTAPAGNGTRPELVPGTLDMLVLRALVTGSMHGYGIARRLEQVTDDVLRVEEGSLYPALHRMERRGWLAASWGRSDAGRRAKYYELTGDGRKQLDAQTAAWERAAWAIQRVLRADWQGA